MTEKTEVHRLSPWVEWLWREAGLARESVRRILKQCPVDKEISLGLVEELAARLTLPEKEIHAITKWVRGAHCRTSPFAFLSFLDPAYSKKLSQLHDPPCVLYHRGRSEILQQARPWVAVVGTRMASNYAMDACEQVIQQIAPFDPVILSGMAQGIDGQAHRSALDRGLSTVGVTGTPLDRVYPVSHAALQRRMIQEGLLVSEVYPGALMGPWRFPERNRLIAALADAVVVIEAPERSGALLTAHLALELGRDIFVVPGPITFPHNLGGHRLIQQGAQLLTHGREIFASLGFTARPESGGTFPQVAPTAEEQSLLEILSGDPLHVDKIVLISHLPAPSVMARLMDLCLKGWVVELAGGYYKKVCNFI